MKRFNNYNYHRGNIILENINCILKEEFNNYFLEKKKTLLSEINSIENLINQQHINTNPNKKNIQQFIKIYKENIPSLQEYQEKKNLENITETNNIQMFILDQIKYIDNIFYYCTIKKYELIEKINDLNTS